ncbi:MAG TPA: hypothetical protein VFL15_07325, partial [Gammaproteobacteria bacterium]|nr:hypothetical protein [Gammaproteobacteria bacterium]
VAALAGDDFNGGLVEEFHEQAPSVSVEAHFRGSESYAGTKAPQVVAALAGDDFNGGLVEELHGLNKIALPCDRAFVGCMFSVRPAIR